MLKAEVKAAVAAAVARAQRTCPCLGRSGNVNSQASRAGGALRVHLHRPPGQSARSLTEALALARAFSGAEPAAVLVSIEKTERQWSLQVSRPGGADFTPDMLNEYRAAWALIRQWTGHDPAIAQREATIQP